MRHLLIITRSRTSTTNEQKLHLAGVLFRVISKFVLRNTTVSSHSPWTFVGNKWRKVSMVTLVAFNRHYHARSSQLAAVGDHDLLLRLCHSAGGLFLLSLGQFGLILRTHGIKALLQHVGEGLHFLLRLGALGKHEHEFLAIDVAELALRLDTIPYEILTGIGRGVARAYVN